MLDSGAFLVVRSSYSLLPATWGETSNSWKLIPTVYTITHTHLHTSTHKFRFLCLIVCHYALELQTHEIKVCATLLTSNLRCKKLGVKDVTLDFSDPSSKSMINCLVIQDLLYKYTVNANVTQAPLASTVSVWYRVNMSVIMTYFIRILHFSTRVKLFISDFQLNKVMPNVPALKINISTTM